MPNRGLGVACRYGSRVMEADRLLRERCQALSETDLVRSLTLERADNSAAFVNEALREFERRGTTLDACIDRVELRAGPRTGQTSIDAALTLVNDDVPRRAVASFTHYLGETLVLQREGWGWVLHFYAEDRYGLSYLIDGTDVARKVVERFLRLQPWRDEAGEGHHLDDWKTLISSDEAERILALSDRLAAAGVPHAVRPALFTPRGDESVALLVPRERRAEADQVAGLGEAPVRRLHHQAEACDEAGDLAGELAAYDELVATDGNNHAVHYNRGVVLLESGRHEEAAAAFMEAAARGLVKLKPDHSLGRGPSGGGLLGLVGVGARLLGRAISSPPGSGFPDWLEDVELRLQSLLDRFGPRSDLLHSLASLARVKGDSAAAVERYHAILALHPDDEVARFQLEYLAAAGD
jgi:tetratricopeptide (TPR) repeat protein